MSNRVVAEIDIERIFSRKRDALRHEEYYQNPVEVKWNTAKLAEYMISELEEVRRELLKTIRN